MSQVSCKALHRDFLLYLQAPWLGAPQEAMRIWLEGSYFSQQLGANPRAKDTMTSSPPWGQALPGGLLSRWSAGTCSAQVEFLLHVRGSWWGGGRKVSCWSPTGPVEKPCTTPAHCVSLQCTWDTHASFEGANDNKKEIILLLTVCIPSRFHFTVE